jgi:Ribonuclease T2 family
MKRVITWALLSVVALAVPIAAAKKHHRHHPRRFDHYVLALSWAPNYCASHPTDHSTECQTRGHKAFVLHGLWPQANNAPPPMSCAPARPVAQSIVDHMLQLMPTRALIQHEWGEARYLQRPFSTGLLCQGRTGIQEGAGSVRVRNVEQSKRIRRQRCGAELRNNQPCSAAGVSCFVQGRRPDKS